jgi:crotonobetainyl-CoA:carnitine CoA-transferase CaiB-like acyl-CoA transferase
MDALEGIRILELARVAPGELCTLLLADMGADVLKVETPPAGPPGEQERRRAAFSFLNRNKRSMALNLKDPEGQAVFRRLAAEADVVVEGFRPGVMKRLGSS